MFLFDNAGHVESMMRTVDVKKMPVIQKTRVKVVGQAESARGQPRQRPPLTMLGRSQAGAGVSRCSVSKAVQKSLPTCVSTEYSELPVDDDVKLEVIKAVGCRLSQKENAYDARRDVKLCDRRNSWQCFLDLVYPLHKKDVADESPCGEYLAHWLSTPPVTLAMADEHRGVGCSLCCKLLLSDRKGCRKVIGNAWSKFRARPYQKCQLVQHKNQAVHKRAVAEHFGVTVAMLPN